MQTAALATGLARRLPIMREKGAILAAFSATLFLSALLLFSVQPMFAKLVLPKLGGSPSVWAVSMVFFQAALLAGYCYAHLLNRFVSPRVGPLIHLVVCGLALLALPIGLPQNWSEPSAGDTYLWLIGLLSVGVGLPFLAVSANAPLLQSWFARTGHPHAGDPYFLYGASNLGSLAALIAYPIVIEPFSGLVTQGAAWMIGFVMLGVSIAICGLVMLVNGRDLDVSPLAVRADAATAPAKPITWADRLHWVLLAAVPSGLLVAFTTYVTTDIASAPFLWVIPLAIFLATFIMVFRPTPTLPHAWMLKLQPMLVGLVLFGMSLAANKGWLIECFGGFAAFLVTTLVCHRDLFERRPEAASLTEFYLWMSLGGVVGGMFAALVAPQIFPSVWEYPLLLVIGIACRPGLLASLVETEVRRILVAVTAVFLAVACLIGSGLAVSGQTIRISLVVACALIAALMTTFPARQLAALSVALIMWVLPSALNRGNSERSFFGVHVVTTSGDGQMRLLMHGTTIHGAERIKTADGQPMTSAPPATYYHPDGPMGQGVVAARETTGKANGGLRVGTVGLGAGSMACASRAGESWRFYEIDPVVERIARDRKRFTYLSRCQPNADIVLGDARLTLAREPAGTFDYLVIDAFSSDAVPVHLLTAEAMKLYIDKLAPDGLLALHVSNRHLDLISVVRAVVDSLPGLHAVLANDAIKDVTFDRSSSHVVFVAKSPAALAAIGKRPFIEPLPATSIRPWTDDFSDIVGALWRKYRNGGH